MLKLKKDQFYLLTSKYEKTLNSQFYYDNFAYIHPSCGFKEWKVLSWSDFGNYTNTIYITGGSDPQELVYSGYTVYDLNGKYWTKTVWAKYQKIYDKGKLDKETKAYVTFQIAECYRHMGNFKKAEMKYKAAISKKYQYRVGGGCGQGIDGAGYFKMRRIELPRTNPKSERFGVKNTQ